MNDDGVVNVDVEYQLLRRVEAHVVVEFVRHPL